MATLKEYYEKDFSNYLRMSTQIHLNNNIIESSVFYDFASLCAFGSCYVEDQAKPFQFYLDLIEYYCGKNVKLIFTKEVLLPALKDFPGKLRIENTDNFNILCQYFGDSEWLSIMDVQRSRRLFIYSEKDLTPPEIQLLKNFASKYNHNLQFRSNLYKYERNLIEKPLAFICHDSRDKINVASKITFRLQQMLCPVWYDEFSLKVGDHLRSSIEKGLKECKKCILVLSPNFISNSGWTKVEFDSIFTRQILEEKRLVLPVWYNVSKQDVYNYSPSLLNIVGADWNNLGENEVCRRIYNEIYRDP